MSDPAQPPADPGAQAPAAAPLAPPAQPALPLSPAPLQVAAALPPPPAVLAQPAPAPAPKAQPADPQAERVATLEKRQEQLRANLIRSELHRYAGEAGVISPEDFHRLVAEDFDLSDDGNLVVRGDPRVTPKDHLNRFLSTRAWMLKPVVPPTGAGAPATVQVPGQPKPLDLTTKDGLTSLARQLADSAGYRPQQKPQ